MKEILFKTIGVVCLTLLSGVVNSQQTDNEVAKASEVDTSSNVLESHSERMIFIDPETGKVASGQQQIDLSGSSQLRSTAAVPTPGLASAPQRLKNGTIKINLNGQFTIPVSVSLDEDGNLEQGHHIDATQSHDKELR